MFRGTSFLGGLMSEIEGKSELEVLIDQLDELMVEGAVSSDDALELAAVAGLAARLGAPHEALVAVRAWLAEGGKDLVEEAIDEVDFDDLVEALDNLEGADEHDVEEALSDFDDLVAAAWFTGFADKVRPAARAVSRIIRQVPDPFAFMAETGRQMARSRAVAEDLDLHDFWLAIAEAETWS
jgi:hypothetical protein